MISYEEEQLIRKIKFLKLYTDMLNTDKLKVGQMLGRAIATVLITEIQWKEGSCGTERSPFSAKGPEQNLVCAVCSLDVLWRSVHYCIQGTGQVTTDRHAVLEFS